MVTEFLAEAPEGEGVCWGLWLERMQSTVMGRFGNEPEEAGHIPSTSGSGGTRTCFFPLCSGCGLSLWMVPSSLRWGFPPLLSLSGNTLTDRPERGLGTIQVQSSWQWRLTITRPVYLEEFRRKLGKSKTLTKKKKKKQEQFSKQFVFLKLTS